MSRIAYIEKRFHGRSLALIAEVGAKRAAPAAVWGSLTLLFGAFNVVSYTHDHWAVVPAVAGAFVGTYVAVKRSK
jgi:hypothetical protein